MSEANYKGLANIGATCYINSFLQTLFMTPQFRDHIYQWTYNEKIHPDRKDSILFQLQKLFAKLELKSSDISTNQLVKSFQWQDDEAFLQQDIQEFNRVLFEALQKSLHQAKDPNGGMIKELYEGQLAHFTKCLECCNESSREETFQDLILIIKNVYEKIYNPSIEVSLQRYIKPELLDQNNLYDCSICMKKVRAQRGVKFIKLPKLLNVVLQRFHFDYFTMTRTKINDKITFPHILNFNTYFHSYEEIPDKLKEDYPDYFLQEEPPKKTVVKPKPPQIMTKKIVSKAGTTATNPSIAGKVKTKPSANTKSFLQEMRRKKMNQQLYQNEDLIFVSGTATVKEPQPSENFEKKIEDKIEELSVNHLTKIEEEKIQKETEKSTKVDEVRKIEESLPPPPPPQFLIGLEPPKLSEPYSSANLPKTNQSNEMIPEKQLEKLITQKQTLKVQRQKDLQQQQRKNRELTEQYLKDGPLVYELYSILVHSGTSNAGHYISYIKSFENDKWYLFNDQRVTQCNVHQVDKTFGGSGASNAYVLYYRLIDQNKYKLQSKIPQYVEKMIRDEEQSYKMRQISKLIDLENILILKIYFQLGVRTIEINKNSSLELLFEKCKDTFNIKTYKEGPPHLKNENSTYVKEDNIRIRLFNPVNDSKLDTYRGKDKESLENLGIRSYQNFLLELKADSEEFDDYVAGFMSIRVALWEDNPNLTSLQEKYINLHKVSINRLWAMKQIEAIIKKKRSQFLGNQTKIEDCICIVKRHQNDEYLYHEIINLPEYYDKSCDSIGIFEGQILFIEPDSQHLNWPQEFQNEINRINVKIINSSNSLDHHTVTTDSRITLNEFKKKICELVNQSVDETIVRRGTKSGLQLKNGNATLKQNRFINGTTLYLEKGLPAKMGEIRIQLFLAEDASPNLFNRLHQFQFIADVPVDTNLKASEVKLIFRNVLKKLRDIDLDPEKIRIREKVNDKVGKIYRERPMKEQQLIQKRQIAIESIIDNLQMKDFSIYVRVWDQQNWQLSPKYQLIVNKNTTMKDLSLQIHTLLLQRQEQTIILPEEMDICRILSIHKFSIIDLVDMEYFGMTSQVSVLGEPMFVNADGLLYIVKQTGIEPRELTKEQENLFGGKIKNLVRPTRGRVYNSTNPQKKEKGITIKVVEKEQQKPKVHNGEKEEKP